MIHFSGPAFNSIPDRTGQDRTGQVRRDEEGQKMKKNKDVIESMLKLSIDIPSGIKR